MKWEISIYFYLDCCMPTRTLKIPTYNVRINFFVIVYILFVFLGVFILIYLVQLVTDVPSVGLYSHALVCGGTGQQIKSCTSVYVRYQNVYPTPMH